MADNIYFSGQPGSIMTDQYTPPHMDYHTKIHSGTRRLQDPQIDSARLRAYAMSLDDQGWQRNIRERLRVFEQEIRKYFRECGFDDLVNGRQEMLTAEQAEYDNTGDFFKNLAMHLLALIVLSRLGLDLKAVKARLALTNMRFNDLLEHLKETMIKQEVIRLVAINTQSIPSEIKAIKECVAYSGAEVDIDRTNNLLDYIATEFRVYNVELRNQFWASNDKSVNSLINLVGSMVIHE